MNYQDIYTQLQQGRTYQDIANELGVSYDQLRGGVRRYRSANNLPSPFDITQTKEIRSVDEFINSPRTLEELADLTGLSIGEVQDQIDELIESGLNIRAKNGVYQVRKDIPLKGNVKKMDWNGETTIRFGVVSDTHMGSVYEQMSGLEYLYDYFNIRGVKTVYHVGDITEGQYNQRQGHVYECHKHGYEQQLQHVIDNYPKISGIETHFITGNHDSTYLKQSGALIGKAIANAREDMLYLGQDNARVWITPKCLLELNHPADGATYAVSHSLQKYIDSLQGDKKPKILLNGHHHKACYVMHRGIHGFESGTTQAQSDFMRGKKIPAHVGGWLITVDLDKNGEITRLVPEFIPINDIKKNDY